MRLHRIELKQQCSTVPKRAYFVYLSQNEENLQKLCEIGMMEPTFKEVIIPEELAHYPVHTTSVGHNLELTSAQLSNVKSSSGGSKMKVVRQLPELPDLFRWPCRVLSNILVILNHSRVYLNFSY